MKTLHGHFCHYYKNLGLIGKIGSIFIDEKLSAIMKAINFGILYETIASMLTPMELVYTHKSINYLKIPKEEQDHLLKIEEKMKALKDYFLRKEMRTMYSKLLEDGNNAEIERMLDDGITDLWFAFQKNFEELSKFKTVYDSIQMDRSQWRNIAPKLCRQRITIEAITSHCVTPDEFKDYLLKLSGVVGMRLLEHGSDPNPSAYDAENMGYGGWIHWVTSGAHMYSYPAEVTGGAGHLLSVDAYTCKPFSVEKAVEFTREYFKPLDIVWREF